MSPDKKSTKPLDIYVRVSRVGGRSGESFISPEVQEERCRAMATAKSYRVGEVFTDLDQTGGKMDRPEFERAMERIRSGQSGGMIVQKLDRFARNTRGLLEAVEEMQDHGAALVIVEGGIDTADPVYGQFLLTLFGGLAQLELGRIGAAWATAHERHIARGVPTGRAPAGYRKDENGRLVVVPEYAEVVREAFELRANGGSWGAVRDLLNEHGVPTATGNAWIERTASRLLGNRTLLGEVRFGEMVNKDAHDPIISVPLFNKVQRTRGDWAPRARKEPALLAGILRCATCERKMTHDTNRRNGDKPYHFYRCRSEHHKDRPTIGATGIEEYLTTAALTHAGTIWGTEKLGDEGAYAEAQAGLAQAQADRLEVEELAGKISPANLAIARTEADAEVARWEETVAEAAESGDVSQWFIPGPGTAGSEAADTRTTFSRMPVDRKRQVLAAIIERATVTPVPDGSEGVKIEDRVRITWR
jgi:site-specific DNA recombinase